MRKDYTPERTGVWQEGQRMDTARRKKRKVRRQISISRVIALTFLGLILLGAAVLNLPVSSRNGRSAGVIVSLFTATSATCVTGLTLRDTWTQWSSFGQGMILLMIEIGGLGFMSAASLAYFSLRRRFSIQQQMQNDRQEKGKETQDQPERQSPEYVIH